MMSHAAFVTLSYAAAAVIIGGLTLSIWLDGRARKRELADLEAAGIRRRSEAGRERA